MQCSKCESSEIRKNGRVRDRQRYRCKDCGYQFMEPKYFQPILSAEIEAPPVLNAPNISDVVTISIIEHLTVPEVKNTDKEAVTIADKELLKKHTLPEFIDSVALQDILLKIQELLQLQSQAERGISILLLDAENLNKFDTQVEAFLSKLSAYPLQVKIAFANWKNTSGDIELYDRGYQLIHVPPGKNSADAQMIAIGAAICRHYPDAKEVFVCSSDWLLNHLCNELQSQGLNIYRVRKQNNNISVENRQTGEVKHYSLLVNLEIPSFEDLAKQMDSLIKEEQTSITQRIANLSTIINLFQERANLSVNVNPSNIALAAEPNSTFHAHVKEEYVQPIEVNQVAKSNPSSQITNPGYATSIDSMEGLENVLIEMIKLMISEAALDYVSVTNIKARFQSKYKKTADLTIKKFKSNSSLIKFLRSHTKLFTITLVEGEHRVSLTQSVSRDLESPIS